MKSLKDSIRINVPVYEAYNQWTQFESFPRIMEGLREVRQLDDRRVLWRAQLDGHDVEWSSEITEQIPDQVIAWRSVTGVPHHGLIEFDPVTEQSTDLNVSVDYEPAGLLEQLGGSSGIDSILLHRQLERFKQFLERHRHASGGWRGTINPPGGQTS